MEIGIPKEIKRNENRVAMTPTGVHELKRHGHQVFVESCAGIGSGFADEQYAAAGAVIVATAEEAWSKPMVMKVKEPLAEEFRFFRDDLLLFTYLHLAAEPKLTYALAEQKVTAVAYETVQLAGGQLPLLTPMSEIAGRMSVQIGAQFLEKSRGGKGILLGGVPGVRRGKVTIVGGGVVGTSAAHIALGLGADVTIFDTDLNRLRQLDELFDHRVHTIMSSASAVAAAVAESDLAVGAVLIPGAKAPKLVGESAVHAMDGGSVIVDVAIDQGGIFETIDRLTTHDEPVFEKHGVLHYAVANMPGSVPRTSTLALTNATLPYALEIANKGIYEAALGSPPLRKGINVIGGCITHEAVAEAHHLAYMEPGSLLRAASA